jgi:DNA helicase INO80
MDIAKPSEIVSLLLNDDELANLDSTATLSNADSREQISKPYPHEARDLWVDDGDDFFGATAIATDNTLTPSREEERQITTPKAPAKRGRKPGRGRGSHRRKPGPATGDTLPADL